MVKYIGDIGDIGDIIKYMGRNSHGRETIVVDSA